MDEQLITEEEAAKVVGLTRAHLADLRRAGNGPEFVQYVERGKVFYRPSALRVWMDARTHTGASHD